MRKTCAGGSGHVKMAHLVMCAVLLVAWMVLTLPIVFYHIPLSLNSMKVLLNATIMNTTVDEMGCFPYPTTTSGSGGVCQTELTDTLFSLNCDTGETPLVLRDAEASANELLPLLNFLNPSPACREAVVPFLCVFLFGLCDSSGVSIQPTSTQCEHIRDVLCPDEWALALAAGFVELPDCNTFPAEQSCTSTNESSSDGDEGKGTTDLEVVNSTGPLRNISGEGSLECAEGFYRDNSSNICLPSCHSWIQYTKAASTAMDVVISLTAFCGFIVAVATLVLSTLRRKRMFLFPLVLIVYETIGVLLLSSFFIINFTDRPSLFCTSINLLESFVKVTPFCVLSGMVFLYVLMQLTIWWIVHTSILFWKVCFPFSSQQTFKMPQRVRCIHISCMVAGLVIPLLPIVITMADNAANLQPGASFLTGGLGFKQTRFPALLCTPVNRNVAFYSVVLPIDIIFAFGSSLLIVVFWTVIKSKRRSKVATAEKKLLIVMTYYALLIAVALTTHTIATKHLPQQVAAILDYFSCEQRGQNPQAPCSRSGFEELSHPALNTLAYVLLGLFPVANLVFTVNIQELKRCYSKIGHGRQSDRSSMTSSSRVKSSTLPRIYQRPSLSQT